MTKSSPRIIIKLKESQRHDIITQKKKQSVINRYLSNLKCTQLSLLQPNHCIRNLNIRTRIFYDDHATVCVNNMFLKAPVPTEIST